MEAVGIKLRICRKRKTTQTQAKEKRYTYNH